MSTEQEPITEADDVTEFIGPGETTEGDEAAAEAAMIERLLARRDTIARQRRWGNLTPGYHRQLGEELRGIKRRLAALGVGDQSGARQ